MAEAETFQKYSVFQETRKGKSEDHPFLMHPSATMLLLLASGFFYLSTFFFNHKIFTCHHDNG
jgi:hypothetical protein